jgi:hypothetical protein
VGWDGDAYRFDLGETGTEIFLQKGLDSNSLICPSRLGKNSAFSGFHVRFGYDESHIQNR